MRIDMLPRVTGLARLSVAAVLFVSLSGCARNGPAVETPPEAPPSGAATSAADQTIVIERTGGIAGVQDMITVTPDGHWTRGGKRGSPGTGQLTDAQRGRLRTLANSPKLREEASRKASTALICSDAFQYTVSVGSVKVSYADCGGNTTPETAGQIVNLVMSASGAR
jgi:predicted small lipoprotein YifL